MNSIVPVLLTLVLYNALLIGVGLWAKGRNRDVADFYLAGRGLGPWISSISASASSSSAWTLLGVSGAAYAWGLPALWLFPATVGGFLFNWYWVAPRLRTLARDEGAITLSEVIAPAGLGESRCIILRIAAAIIVFCFIFYIASQFEAAGKAFESTFSLPKQSSILIGAGIVLVYSLLGGFWAVSVTDSIQGLLMFIAAIVLPIVSVRAVGGVDSLLAGLIATNNVGSPSESLSAAMTVIFVLGFLAITLNYPGQPHVVNRFMALKDEQSLREGRIIAIVWAVVVYSGMLILGFSARVLSADLGDAEQILFRMSSDLLPPVVAGIMLAAVLSAIMSTADSQLLSASAAISYDWNLADGNTDGGLKKTRITVIVVLVLSTILAIGWNANIYSRVLFAWAATGASFGPILIMRLIGRSLSARGTLTAMLSGFGLTVLFALLPDTPNDFVERVMPLLIAFAIAFRSSQSK
jgi:sodium/proline symporter